MKTGAALPRRKGAGLALLAALWSGPALAACNDAAVVDFIMERDGTGWVSTSIKEFESTEGSGTRESLSGGTDIQREDVQFCVSYYCVESTEMQTPAMHGRLFVFHWGASSFPDANENSLVYSDLLTGETCQIRHRPNPDAESGAAPQFDGSGVSLAEDIMKNESAAAP